MRSKPACSVTGRDADSNRSRPAGAARSGEQRVPVTPLVTGPDGVQLPLELHRIVLDLDEREAPRLVVELDVGDTRVGEKFHQDPERGLRVVEAQPLARDALGEFDETRDLDAVVVAAVGGEIAWRYGRAECGGFGGHAGVSTGAPGGRSCSVLVGLSHGGCARDLTAD